MSSGMDGSNCPECGAGLSAEPWSAGLCLSCLLELGLTVPSPPAPGAAPNQPTLSGEAPPFDAGQVLGNRYRVRTLLGRGGMGDVFRAFDLKLRVDVALKAVRPSLVASERALEGLRQEVRAAREVVSPNVCRVFDLIELDGRELVSMEYIDGSTLAELLRERSPIPLPEAREIASQLLAGLESIHAAGLVHRDVKPENVMLTRAGRVVVMDFGIARPATHTRIETISGTPAYMAIEQARGQALDARADVFAAGVVLAEMVAPEGARTTSAREAIWRGIHDSPPRVADTPWAPVLRTAVAPMRDQRFATAAALSRALDAVSMRSAEDEGARPYPGLAAFTEDNAAYFLGRELEIEDLWKKLRRPHLLALIGPSGAGKSSLLRAGLVPTAPPGWSVIVTTPGTRPFAALAHALAPELAGDTDAVSRLIDFEQPAVAVEVTGRWRRRHGQALLVFDQFEELFTQSAADVQAQFAQLLARLALESDIHVLLSLRDDFLVNCHRFESLSPIFSDLTAIGPPAGAALRRALVQPALKCGYKFEDESMVDEIVAEVAGERGALPLAAFAMARLWDARDREQGLLTRSAYQAVGGVGGALAQHAEATLDRIGHDRVPVVREIFRNLVTAAGTRVTLEREELLSVFARRESPGPGTSVQPVVHRDRAAEVLDALVDARLLTVYERPGLMPDEPGRPHIEIVHESLLTSWPRLVRWRTQDQDGAQLRDQLRQAARLWEDRGQPDDLLWTGTSYREYELWRERYGGTLSAAEDRFARAMRARALKRRRQRQLATALVTAAALAVAVAMAVLWRQSEAARGQALTAARQSEAQQLYTLGQMSLTQDPTAALAYALASLERADRPHVRRLALDALWAGPPGFAVASDAGWGAMNLAFSSDGEWLAGVEDRTGIVRLWRRDGSAAVEIPGTAGPGNFAWGEFGPDGRSFVITRADGIRIHALPSGQEVRRIAGTFRWGRVRGDRVITGAFAEPTADGRSRRLIRAYPLPGGSPEIVLGILTGPRRTAGAFDIDQQGLAVLGVYDGALYEVPLAALDSAHRLIVHGDDPIATFRISRDGAHVYTWHESGAVQQRLRTTGVPQSPPRHVRYPRSLTSGDVSNKERWLVSIPGTDAFDLWDLAHPAAFDRLPLRTGGRTIRVAFDPTEQWMAIQDNRAVTLWPLLGRRTRVLRTPGVPVRAVAGDPSGRWLAAGTGETSTITMWPLTHDRKESPTMSALPVGIQPHTLAVSPRGDAIAMDTMSGAWIVRLPSGKPERLPGFTSLTRSVTFDTDGRRVAAGGGLLSDLAAKGEAVIRVWNLDTRDTQVLPSPDGTPIAGVAFLSEGGIVSAGPGGVRQWDLAGNASVLLMPDNTARVLPSPDSRYLLVQKGVVRPGGVMGTAAVYDRHTKRSWDLPAHGSEVTAIAWDRSGAHIITASRDGTIRVGARTGEEPHLLIGHESTVWDLFVTPDGRSIVSGGEDGTVRVWPMVKGTPFHTLPHDEILGRLRALTNYRVVADPRSTTGYRVSFAPFTGWQQPPPHW